MRPTKRKNTKDQDTTQQDMLEAVRATVPAALARLEALLQSENESISLKAAQIILDRAYGRTRQEPEIEDPRAKLHPQQIVLVGWKDDKQEAQERP